MKLFIALIVDVASLLLYGALEKAVVGAWHSKFQASGKEPGIVFVEWLESSKNFIQWVDTGIVPTSNCTIYGKYQRQGADGYNAGDYNYLFGGNYDGDPQHSCYGVFSHGPWQTKFDFESKIYGGRLVDWNYGVTDKSVQELVMDKTSITVNGYTTTTQNVQPEIVKSEQTFTLFSFGTKANQVRIWYCRIEVDGEPLIDLVPARVGRAGYFYDKVSGELFGVSGDGELTIGPDL